MAACDFAFLTDDCIPDNGELRIALEHLCDLATEQITINDPNSGVCGEYGTASTIFSVTVQPGNILEISANPAWGAAAISFIDTVTFGPPLDIDPVAFYPSGASLALNIVNPSACRSLVVYGNYYSDFSINYRRGAIHLLELRDISAGLPGLVLDDKIYHLNTTDSQQDRVLVTPFLTTIAPGGTFTQTVQNTITTTSSGGGPGSDWNQSILNVAAIGALI